ncbi:MAG: DUF87 domain-containing protein [Candidatus Micrarchaeaceae archaeon]
MELYRIDEMPNGEIDKRVFFEAIGNSLFSIEYRLEEHATILGISGNHGLKVQMLHNFVHGMKLSHLAEGTKLQFDATIISGYSSASHDIFSEIFSLPVFAGSVIVVFVPASEKDILKAKKFIEAALSNRKVRETNSEPQGALGARSMSSSQREIFNDSDEALVLNGALNLINESILNGGIAYKFFVVMPSNNTVVFDYLKSKFLILGMRHIKAFGYDSIGKLQSYPALPFSPTYLSALMSFKGNIRANYVVNTSGPMALGDLDIGFFADGGVRVTETHMKIDASTLNLGFIITGLPGTGKTNEAMAIVDQLLAKAQRPKIIVIAPTDEWSHFALAHGMNLIRLYNDQVPINFFRKPPRINKEKFYENLAMVLASASDAGPYQNPMEKCMLNAFRKVYESSEEPDPVEVYDEIEESVIELHAKRTQTGIKYTKHGENIRSALENLRAILSRPEYAADEGVKIEELLEKGVVFDISGASASTKQYLYALILNQVYATATGFDTLGDNELRLAIILEEAQTIFGNKESTAVQDIKQRMQDFRKQGIGLLLLAHNISDIESGIRRLCQLKLYLRQASDIAPIAVKDLAFAYADDDDATLKLKMLGSGMGALSYISKEGDAKVPHDTVFIKTLQYKACAPDNSIRQPGIGAGAQAALPKYIESKISIDFSSALRSYEKNAGFIKIIFLGEGICTCGIERPVQEFMVRMLEGKSYTIQVLDRKKRMVREIKVKAAAQIHVKMEEKEGKEER